MILTKAERMYFNIQKSKGLIQPLKESCYVKSLKEIEKKLPINEN